MNINELGNKILKLRADVLHETDKDKKIELYERILNETAKLLDEQEKVVGEGIKELNKFNETLNTLAKLSITNPKECRRKLKEYYKAL